MREKFVYGALVLLAIVLAVVILAAARPRGTPQLPPPVTPPPVAYTIKALAANDLAAALPANFPGDPAAKVLQSAQATNPQNGQVEILRTTTTAGTIASAFAVYQNYLNQNGWTIAKTDDVPQLNLKSISADKGTAHMDITVSYNGGAKSNAVTVVYTVPK